VAKVKYATFLVSVADENFNLAGSQSPMCIGHLRQLPKTESEAFLSRCVQHIDVLLSSDCKRDFKARFNLKPGVAPVCTCTIVHVYTVYIETNGLMGVHNYIMTAACK
jgi:hypothetical protein